MVKGEEPKAEAPQDTHGSNDTKKQDSASEDLEVPYVAGKSVALLVAESLTQSGTTV